MVVLKSWRAVMGPKGIPKPILTLLENMMKKITADPTFIEKAEKLKIGVEFRAGDDLRRDLLKDTKDFADLVKELNLKQN
jgi:tripartite-type tricarboxylate transporter receptor subunit TctC